MCIPFSFLTCVSYFIGIPPVDNLMVVDNCTSVTDSWDITDEGPCRDLSYNVLLTSLDDGVILQSVITNDTSHTFTGVEGINETLFSVNVSTFNENATGPSRTAPANVEAPNGQLLYVRTYVCTFKLETCVVKLVCINAQYFSGAC